MRLFGRLSPFWPKCTKPVHLSVVLNGVRQRQSARYGGQNVTVLARMAKSSQNCHNLQLLTSVVPFQTVYGVVCRRWGTVYGVVQRGHGWPGACHRANT